MKRKSFIKTLSIIGALCVPALSFATIYLMKGEKIVATYPDDAVEYITFEAPETPPPPSEYDVDTRSYFLYTSYYGDNQLDNGYNYILQFSDYAPDEKGNLPLDAVYYSLFLYGPDVADKKEPYVPEGTYTLDAEGLYSILGGENSMVMNGPRHYFKEAWLKVTQKGKQWEYEFTGVTDDDKTFHTVFNGVPQAYNQAIEWIKTDVNVQGGDVIGYYLDASKGGGPTGNGCNLTIKIAEYGYDSEGWLVTPCNYITLVGNVKMDERGNIEPGEWTVSDAEYTEENTLRAGTCINFAGMAAPVYSTVQSYNEKGEVEVGLITEGTMKVTKSKINTTFTYDFTTKNGKKVSGVFQGQIILRDNPYAESLKLDKNYKLDFTDHRAICWEYPNKNELYIEINKHGEGYQYLGDRLALTLVPSNGKTELQPGIYKVVSDNKSVGKIVPGTYIPQTGASTPSVFVKFSDTEAGKVLKAATIEGGQVEVIKNTDGTWTFKVNLLDGQENPKSITGTWTGKFES